MSEVLGEDAVEAGREFLAGLLSKMGQSATITLGDAPDDRTVVFDLQDASGGLESQELMASLGLLVARVVSRESETTARCVVDVGGRYAHSRTFLHDAAQRLAAAVERSGRRAALQGLSSPERRIVHTALVDDARVETRSEGRGDGRALLVEPAEA